jgi:hypothetical protein
MKSILKSLLSKPKTYLPLIVILLIWGLGLFGIDISDAETKEALTVVCGAIAAGFLRQGMVKNQELNNAIDTNVKKRLDTLLDNIAAAKDATDEAIDVDRELIAVIRKEMKKIEVDGIDANEIAEYIRLKNLERTYNETPRKKPGKAK